MPRETDFPYGHAPRTELGERVTYYLQATCGVANLDLRNTVELILAVLALKEELK